MKGLPVDLIIPLKVVAFKGANGAIRNGVTTKSSVDAAKAAARLPSSENAFILLVANPVQRAGLSPKCSMKNAELVSALKRLVFDISSKIELVFFFKAQI